MTTINEAKIKIIADTYGFISQREILIEECAELIQAVMKCKRAINTDETTKATDNFIEELADVTIMIEQMIYFMPATLKKNYDEMITQKLDRQIERINADKEEYEKWRKGVKA